MIKTILVHLNGTGADVSVLTTASQVARPFAAHLECLHITPSLADLVGRSLRLDYDDESGNMGEALDLRRKAAAAASESARQNFLAFCRREDIAQIDTPPAHVMSAAWRAKAGREADQLVAQGRYHDLVVVAGTGPAEGLSIDEIGRIIFESGRPVLIAPPAPSPEPIRTVAIAWKDTPEAARAVTAAMPLLSQAKRIVVLIADESNENQAALECVECTDSVVNQLRWHGLHAEARYVVAGGRTIPDALRDSAREAGADLLVMGAYGHSRLRELVFGGVTRHVLAGTTLPVFMAH